jgi:hypothetical protein
MVWAGLELLLVQYSPRSVPQYGWLQMLMFTQKQWVSLE